MITHQSDNIVKINKDKQKEEALILILKRKAELQKDIFRVKKDIQENLKEISFFEDPAQHEKNRQQAKRKL